MQCKKQAMDFYKTKYTKEYSAQNDNVYYIAPCFGLQKIVAHYTLTYPNNQEPENKFLDLIPDGSGCMMYIITQELEKSLTLWGPTTEVVRVSNNHYKDTFKLFIEFLPMGLYQICGIDLDQLTNQKSTIKAVNLDLHNELETIFEVSDSVDQVINAIEKVLLREAEKHEINPTCAEMVKIVNTSCGTKQVSDIAKELFVSDRQLNRLANKYVGMSVKKYSKVVRINSIVQYVKANNNIDCAFEYGFFDHAHYDKLFKGICGETPSEYLENVNKYYNELYKF